MPGAWPDELSRGPLTWFPVVPGRFEFALEVRRALLSRRPRVVAVDLPASLEPAYLSALARLPKLTVIACPLDDDDEDQGIMLVVEPADPFVEAIRTAVEIGSEIVFVAPDDLDEPAMPAAYPDSVALRHAGLDAYIDAWRRYPPPSSPTLDARASALAWRLQGCDPIAPTFAVVALHTLNAVASAFDAPQDPPRAQPLREAELLNPHPDCLAEITREYPFLLDRYEQARLDPENGLDRYRVQYDLLRDAGMNYEAQTGERIVHWQRRLLARYTRNLALTEGQLSADLFDITVAARSIVDDNFAWEVWHAANAYAPQSEESSLETVRLSGDEVFLRTRRMRLRRRRPHMKQFIRPRGLHDRPKEWFPGEWAAQIDGDAICSYPPEDLVIEDYCRFLRQRARSLLTAERVRVEPFTTSLLDGIDVRETIRNWHRHKIFVRHYERRSGDVGAVVLIFDEDRDDRYSSLTTWHGEHQNESDMAFYSTPPFDHMIGPGIGRAEYGGLLMVLPPRRMMDIWSDPDYDFAESKSERLLLAALDYSVERHVVYVAAKPPRPIFRSIASSFGRSIFYLPIGQLSPARLKKIRVVHVLDGHDRRSVAKRYLW